MPSAVPQLHLGLCLCFPLLTLLPGAIQGPVMSCFLKSLPARVHPSMEATPCFEGPGTSSLLPSGPRGRQPRAENPH